MAPNSIITENFTFRPFPEEGYLYMKVKGFTHGEEIRDNAEYLYQMLQQHPIRGLLCDLSELDIVGQEDQAFAVGELVPRLQKNGIRYFAYVIPHTQFGTLSFGDMQAKARQMNTYDESTERYYSHELQEAQSWITQRCKGGPAPTSN